MPLEEIAEKLNAEKVPTIHGTNRWTATSVRKASFPSSGTAKPRSASLRANLTDAYLVS